MRLGDLSTHKFMQAMSKDEFIRKWEDTHRELSALDRLEKGRKGRYKEPGDKNIRTYGKIPGKNVIEKECLQKRSEDLGHLLMDVVAVRAKELLDVEIPKVVSLALRSVPQQINQNNLFINDPSKMADLYKRTLDIEAEIDGKPSKD